MAEIKISEMDELIPYDHYTLEGGTDLQDYIPIIDSSEIDLNLQNKRVSVGTLFDDYTRQYNQNGVSPEEVKEKLLEYSKAYVTRTNLIQVLPLTYVISNSSNPYLFLDPNGQDRGASIAFFPTVTSAGVFKTIKNIGTSNTITLSNMVTANNTQILTYIIQPGKTVRVIYDGIDHHVIELDESFIIPPSALSVNSSAPSVTSTDVGLLGLNNNIPQYVNSGGSWSNLASSNYTVYQQIKLRRITSTQSIIANTFPATLFNQVNTTTSGTPIGSFNTITGILTLDTVGTYMFVGTLTLNGGVSGTRAIFYAEATLTGQVDTQTRVESAAICNSAGSFIIPINFIIKVLVAPTTFKLTTASSTNVSIANADSTLSSFAESQVTIVKIN